jgi:hypothetical protein
VGAHLFGQQPEQGGIGTIDLLPQVFPVRTQDIASEPSFNAAKLGLEAWDLGFQASDNECRIDEH